MGKQSGFCLTVFFAGLLNIDAITGDTSECTSAAVSGGIPYIRMCEDARVTADRMLLDTHLAATTGETTCSCSAETNVPVVFYLQYYGADLNPNAIGCGSRIIITSPSVNSPFECNMYTSNPLVALPMNLTWSGASVGDSKYCIDITTDPSAGSKMFTMVCSKPGTTFTTSSTRPSTTKAAETTVQTTTVTETRTTTSEVTTSAMTTVSNTDQGTSRRAEDTRTDTNPQRPEDSVPLIIAIPSAVGGFVLIITIVIIAVVCSKKHKQSSKRGESYIDDTVELNGTTRPKTNSNGENSDEEGDGMKRKILYESFDQEASNDNHSRVQLRQSTLPDGFYAEIEENRIPQY